MRWTIAPLLALAGASAAAQAAPPDHVGRIYTYVRSNSDGSEAETVHVYRASRERIEVSKMRERCTNAAFVTADLDLAAGQAVRLTGGRLRPNAEHQDFALLTFAPEARRIDARIDMPSGSLDLSTPVGEEPWHLYDFDLASLTIAAQYRADRRRDFSFGVPLIWLAGDPNEALRYLGRADARFAGEEEHEGRPALRFDVGGPAFGERGGQIWFDAAEGHIVGARLGLPNHAEYRDFALRLTGVSDGGAEAWRRLLAAHFEGCPAEG